MRVIRPLLSEMDRVRARLNLSDRVLVALDYDGTIAPIAETPEAARLPSETARVLREIAALDRFSLAVVSGRSLADLKRRLALDAIYVGNHGLEIEGGGFSFVHEQAERMRRSDRPRLLGPRSRSHGGAGRDGRTQGTQRYGALPAGAAGSGILDRARPWT